MKLIDRPLYLQRLMDVKGTPDIKVITGIRRCGKSKLMESFIKKIKETETDANILKISMKRIRTTMFLLTKFRIVRNLKKL